MYNFLWVALGGAVGSLLRYSLSLMFPYKESSFPISTFLSNMASSFLLGIAAALMIHKFGGHHPMLKYFIIIGICGGFSTFSSFALELFNFQTTANWVYLVVYSVLSVLLSVLFVYIGFVLIKNFI